MGYENENFNLDDLDFDIFKKINKIHHHHERNVKEKYDKLINDENMVNFFKFFLFK